MTLNSLVQVLIMMLIARPIAQVHLLALSMLCGLDPVQVNIVDLVLPTPVVQVSPWHDKQALIRNAFLKVK